MFKSKFYFGLACAASFAFVGCGSENDSGVNPSVSSDSNANVVLDSSSSSAEWGQVESSSSEASVPVEQSSSSLVNGQGEFPKIELNSDCSDHAVGEVVQVGEKLFYICRETQYSEDKVEKLWYVASSTEYDTYG